MSNLTILNTSIRTLNGLYSLNDFHKASGTENHLRPSKFIRNDQTKDLIAEIEKEQSPNLGLACKSLRGGLNAGVWACEELVLAYATWISPKFHLVVLRAFLAMHRGEVQPKQLTLPEPKIFNVELTEHDIKVLNVVLKKFAPKAKAFAKRVEQQQRTLYQTLGLDPLRHNPLAAEGYDIYREFNYWLGHAEELIDGITAQQNLLPKPAF